MYKYLTDFDFDENLPANARKVFLKVILFLLIFIWHCLSTHNNINQAALANAVAEAEQKVAIAKADAEAKIAKTDAHAETKIAKADAETKIVKTNAEAKVAIINADAEKKIAKAEADQKMAEMAFEIQIITMQLECREREPVYQYTARALIEYVENFVIPPNKPNKNKYQKG